MLCAAADRFCPTDGDQGIHITACGDAIGDLSLHCRIAFAAIPADR
jgi:hypothetical protein